MRSAIAKCLFFIVSFLSDFETSLLCDEISWNVTFKGFAHGLPGIGIIAAGFQLPATGLQSGLKLHCFICNLCSLVGAVDDPAS